MITYIDNANRKGRKMQNAAQTILEQLGGNRFLAMTGAKQLVNTGAGLQFGIGRGAKGGINKVVVKLVDDLYDVEFWKIRGVNMQTVATVERVYADKLAEVFTEQTGFDTRL